MSDHKLDDLPIVEKKDTFWFTEYWLNGEMIQRKYLPTLFLEFVRSETSLMKMRIQCKIAFYLLRKVGDHCPRCHGYISYKDKSR